MVCALLPLSAFAANASTLTISGKEYTASASGTGWSWDASKNVLTLSGFKGETIKADGDLSIVLKGANTLTLPEDAKAGIFVSGKLTIDFSDFTLFPIQRFELAHSIVDVDCHADMSLHGCENNTFNQIALDIMGCTAALVMLVAGAHIVVVFPAVRGCRTMNHRAMTIGTVDHTGKWVDFFVALSSTSIHAKNGLYKLKLCDGDNSFVSIFYPGPF